MVVALNGLEVADLAALTSDDDLSPVTDITFPEPVLTDPVLTNDFLRLHRTLARPSTRLERDERLSDWLLTLVERSTAARKPPPTLTPRDDQALRRAQDYLGDQPALNVSLDELAAAAGIGKFRLVRLFRTRTGLPPHALQVAHRIRAARLLLECGETVAATATATGFADQSHLHRHFRRGLGVTPAQYKHRFATPNSLHR